MRVFDLMCLKFHSIERESDLPLENHFNKKCDLPDCPMVPCNLSLTLDHQNAKCEGTNSFKLKWKIKWMDLFTSLNTRMGTRLKTDYRTNVLSVYSKCQPHSQILLKSLVWIWSVTEQKNTFPFIYRWQLCYF